MKGLCDTRVMAALFFNYSNFKGVFSIFPFKKGEKKISSFQSSTTNFGNLGTSRLCPCGGHLLLKTPSLLRRPKQRPKPRFKPPVVKPRPKLKQRLLWSKLKIRMKTNAVVPSDGIFRKWDFFCSLKYLHVGGETIPTCTWVASPKGMILDSHGSGKDTKLRTVIVDANPFFNKVS